jgi:parallel beta-helix repeat protein
MIIIGSIEENPTYLVENITIENLILDGNKANQDYEIWQLILNYIRNNGISIRHCRNVIIRNCVIKNARSGNIVIEKECENITIEGCHLSNAYFDGIACYISKNCIIKNNIIENNVYAGMSFDLQFNDNIISGNTITANDLGIFLRHCDNNLIFGNVLNNKHFDLYFNQIDQDMTTIPKSNSLSNNKTIKDFINQL